MASFATGAVLATALCPYDADGQTATNLNLGGQQIVIGFGGTISQIYHDGSQQPGTGMGALISGKVTFFTNNFVFLGSTAYDNLTTSLYTNASGNVNYTAVCGGVTNAYSYTGFSVLVENNGWDVYGKTVDNFGIQWAPGSENGVFLQFPRDTAPDNSVNSFLLMANYGLSQCIAGDNGIVLGVGADGYGGSSADLSVFFVSANIPAPKLNLKLAGNNAILSWPMNVADFQLQTSSLLGSNANWTTVTHPAVISNGNYSVSVPATNGGGFFRLQSSN